MELQKTDAGIFHIKRMMEEKETKHFRLDERGVLWFKDRHVVPKSNAWCVLKIPNDSFNGNQMTFLRISLKSSTHTH